MHGHTNIKVTLCLTGIGDYELWDDKGSEARDSGIQQSKDRGRNWTKRKGTKQEGHLEQKQKKMGIRYYSNTISQFTFREVAGRKSTRRYTYLPLVGVHAC